MLALLLAMPGVMVPKYDHRDVKHKYFVFVSAWAEAERLGIVVGGNM